MSLSRLLPVALLCLPALAGADVLQQVRTIAPPSAAAGLPYAEALARAGDADRADVLRLGLVTAHVKMLNGTPWAAGTTLGQVMDASASLPAPSPASALAAAWHAAFNRHMALNWMDGAVPLEAEHLADRLSAVRPGGWVMPASGLTRYVAQVQLVNGSPRPVALPGLALRWPGGLLLNCSPASRSRSGHDGWTPAGGAADFVCQEVADTRHHNDFAQRAPELVPANFSSPERYLQLAAAFGQGLQATGLKAAPEPVRTQVQDRRPPRPASPPRQGDPWMEFLGWVLPWGLFGLLLYGHERRRGGAPEALRRVVLQIGWIMLVAAGAAAASMQAMTVIWQRPDPAGALFLFTLMAIGVIWVVALLLMLLGRLLA